MSVQNFNCTAKYHQNVGSSDPNFSFKLSDKKMIF